MLVATRNQHKTNEIAALLQDLFVVRDLSTLPDAPEVEETGSTFAANARLKALALSALVDDLVLADDSGLEVDALEGAPGVYSARYAGPDATDADNNRKLLGALKDTPPPQRTARFRCALVLARAGVVVAEFDGRVEGTLLDYPRGSQGFGYDPLFVPSGHSLTLAELGAETKNTLSHRANALQHFVGWVQTPH